MNIILHVYLHDGEPDRYHKLVRQIHHFGTAITDHLDQLVKQGAAMSANFDRVLAAATSQTTIATSIETLLSAMAQMIRDLAAANQDGVTPAQLDALATEMEANNAKVVQAIVANTPTSNTEANSR